MIGEFAAFVAAALCGAVALAFCALYSLKFRREVLYRAALFHAALFLTILRFCLLYLFKLQGSEDSFVSTIVWRVLYLPAALLFSSQGPAWIHALNGKPLARPWSVALWIAGGILALFNFAADYAPIPPILVAATDYALIWGSTAYILIYCAANMKRMSKGPFFRPLLAIFSGAIAFFCLSAPGWFGLSLPVANYLLPAFFIFVSLVIVWIASRFFLQDQGGAGPGVNGALAAAFGLSAREIEVADLALKGKSGKEIAAALFISPKTVETHLSHIFQKTGARSRIKLYTVLGSGSAA